MDITPIIKMTLLDLRANLRLIREIKELSGNAVNADNEMLARLRAKLEVMKTEIAEM